MERLWNRIAKAIAACSIVVIVMTAGIDMAIAASPPTVVTGQASSVTVTAATVSGTINPNGVSTSWYVQYGTTTGYGLRTSSKSAGSAAHIVAETVRLVGLTPGTTYHYRFVAANAGGTAVGTDYAFRTPALAPTIVSETAGDLHDTSAAIHGVIDPNGLATTWYVRFGTSSSYSLTTATHSAGAGTANTSISIALSGLLLHTTYHFAVVATNAAGTSVGSDASFITDGAPAIEAESVTNLTTTTAVLRASVVPDGHSTKWYFQYGLSTTYGSATTTANAGSATTAVVVAKTIAGLAPNTTYHYRLVASNAIGIVTGNDATFTTPGPTLSASTTSIAYGTTVVLSGTIPGGAANANVGVYAQAVPSTSFVQVATILTGAGGSWSYSLKPQIQTTYKAMWSGEVTPDVTISVAPAVALRKQSGAYRVHVNGEHSFAGRLVRLQRLVGKSWRTIGTRALNRSSTAVFHPSLPRGRVRLRVYFTAYQAGSGYLAGYSAEHVYRVG